MSSAETTFHSDLTSVERAIDAVVKHRTSFAWLGSAAVVLFAAFAITTIRVRDSIFDVFTLQLLTAGLFSVAASNILLAFGVRKEKWHVTTWSTTITTWFVILWVT
ncbi:hypothetical protein Mal4_38150 [Maioricimonas rarisocia]|uniref:Uncharacterized protein n=1 Tax=Maioricimonas rarisocia TaxID=2528026 RepID=A0A517ZAJ8_9PLAN|nr:hypothetical protein [Maioricimonas rarisocia]QDU39470.1 hypothetical protein Mal4_38150 [Maioricimonas rarisocia]